MKKTIHYYISLGAYIVMKMTTKYYLHLQPTNKSLPKVPNTVHKTFQFCGLKQLETYSVHDIFKGDLDLDNELEKFEKLLRKNFL